MTPDERAAMAREVLTQLVNEFTDGTIGEPFRLTPAQRARMLGYIDGEYPAPSPVLPPIPLGAVVEVENDPWAPYTRTEDGWVDNENALSHATDTQSTAPLITALYHARRESGEAERERDWWQNATLEAAAKTERAERERAEATHRALDLSVALQVAEAERDDARRELAAAQGKALEFDRIQRACPAGVDAFDHLMALAAAKDQGIGASAISSRQAPNSEESDCGSAVASPAPAPAPLSDPAPLSGAGNMADSGNQAPAPASAPCGHTNTSPSPDSPHARVAAPRRWWLRRRSDAGWPDAHAYLSEEMARSALYGPTGGGWSDVVPVVEARVTRETVERVAAAMWDRSEPPGERWLEATHADEARNVYRSMARAALRALGLTVEDDHA